MKVLKFGGTSVSGIESQLNILSILKNSDENVILVLSAFSQITNKLEKITELNYKQDSKQISGIFEEIKTYHLKMILQLDFNSKEIQDQVVYRITSILEEVEANYFRNPNKDFLITQGEYWSTFILTQWLIDNGVDAKLFDSTQYISLTEDMEPNMDVIIENFKNEDFRYAVNVFQGYVCLDASGNVSNLQRGGSDYTATIIGAAINATEVQIWTDIDGFHNNDPRYVNNTFPVRFLSFDEAAELAYFGAKILHPNCLQPVRRENVSVYLKNTSAPENQGTLISEKTSDRIVTAIAAKDNIHVIRIESARMLNAHGFLFKVFSVFNKYGKSIDTITTSEVSVSLTIDNDENIFEILNELKEFGKVEFESDLSIVCVVGDFISERKGIVSKITSALSTIPLRMISYGGSENNITLLMDTSNKVEALQSLNQHLFSNQENHARV